MSSISGRVYYSVMLELIFYRLVTTMEVKRVKTINVNGLDSLSFLPRKILNFYEDGCK